MSPESNKTAVFAANMERKLRILFAPECGWSLDYDFDLGELVIFPRIPESIVIQEALHKCLLQ